MAPLRRCEASAHWQAQRMGGVEGGKLMEAPQKWISLQALRAVAVLFVLWAHVKYTGPGAEAQAEWVKSGFGAFGVDLFFVISGFVIAGSADRLRGDAMHFLLQRFIRVVPLYWLFSIPYVVRYSYSPGMDASEWWNTFLFLPIWDVAAFSNPAHPFGWTLSFEVWFYLLFAVCLAVAAQHALTAMALLLMGGVAIVTATYSGQWFFPRFAAHPLVLEFVAGCLIYRFVRRLGLAAALLALVGIVALLPIALDHQALGAHNSVLSDVDLGWQRAVYWGGLAVCIVVLALVLESRHVAFPRYLCKLGDASYSMYLVQPFALSVVKFVALPHAFVAFAFFVAVSTGFGYAVWRYVETPITAYLKSKWLPDLKVRRAAMAVRV